MTTLRVQNILRQEFIDALISFSNNKISMKEAEDIANKQFRISDFTSEDSPLAHKGPRWLALRIVRNMGLLHRDNLSNQDKLDILDSLVGVISPLTDDEEKRIKNERLNRK